MIAKCKGYATTLKKCEYKSNDSGYCDIHEYFCNFSDKEILDIVNKKSTILQCGHCKKWMREITKTKKICSHCLDCTKNSRETIKLSFLRCDVILNDGTQCSNASIETRDDKEICAVHSKYDELYFFQDKDDLKQCSACRKYKNIFDGKICAKCKQISAKNRKIYGKKPLDVGCCGHCRKFSEEITETNKTCSKCKINSKNSWKAKKTTRQECDVVISTGDKCNKESKKIIDGNHVCAVHLRHGNYYFYKDKDNLQFCTSCNKYLPLNTFNGGLCKMCKIRSEKETPKDKLDSYKYGANLRKYEFFLEDEECHAYFCKICAKCGGDNNGKLMGIDRIFNDKGYINTNCEPCCTFCNFIKRENNNDQFYGMSEHILQNLNLISSTGKSNPLLFKNHNACNLKIYKRRADARSLSFELSDNEFEVIKSFDCYLCGKINTNSHTNGIDRIDNDSGYKIGNVLSCCYDCNMFKWTCNIGEFINKLYQIHCFQNKLVPQYDKQHIVVKTNKYIDEKYTSLLHKLKC
jgi:hypothetical protein